MASDSMRTVESLKPIDAGDLLHRQVVRHELEHASLPLGQPDGAR